MLAAGTANSQSWIAARSRPRDGKADQADGGEHVD